MKTFFQSFWATATFFLIAILVNTVFGVPAVGIARVYAFTPAIIHLIYRIIATWNK